MSAVRRQMHDVGGLSGAACRLAPHEVEAWERRIDAMMTLLRSDRRGSPCFTVDQMRRQIESMDSEDYRRAGYYERWAFALASLLIERGVVTADEIGRTLAEAQRPGAGAEATASAAVAEGAAAPKFKPGDRVRVRSAFPPGHVRTPFYCRGRTGSIERTCGSFPNPEELAYGRSGLPAQPLYRVRFASRDLFPDYAESEQDFIEIEVYQHWLEAAS